MTKSASNFDRTDLTLLRSLQRDGRATNAELARDASMSESACLRRVRLLEANGAIERYAAVINQQAVGLPLNVFITITLNGQSEAALRTFETEIAAVPEVMECYLMTGSADYLVRVVARDIDDLERIHSTRLTRLTGVARVTSSIAMRQVIKRAEMAIGHRADVTLFDISAPRLEELDDQFGGRLKTVYSTPDAVTEAVHGADLVIGCVLIPGAAAPKLVSRADLARMKPGAVLVDVAIDQGGCFETSKPTTHADPTYVVDGIIHYCVANMPGAAPLTSAYALGAATAPYISALANKGVEKAFADDPGFAAGLNIQGGRVTYAAVAESLNLG